MKVLLSLSLLCLTLALCHTYCFTRPAKLEFINGVMMLPRDCIDSYDGSKHSSGSRWNSANCLECSCRGGEMSCCSRYGGTASSPGCKAVVNPETCEYEFYRIDDPSEPCF
ncbi:small serum protein 2-like [Sphaerodactylus townsendi]|uniref:small serum protein 2-like n=1 Tax=Sphaerodactylus townsendi TaxID=933632 RepID=UPI0020264558|nr:small serum protein 2-like [Sphaerodactylus townsendi]